MHDTLATLAILRRARTSLASGPFSFHDWTQCTCGHLYAGAEGALAVARGDVRAPRPGTDYAATVVLVAATLSGDERRFTRAGRRWWDRRSPAALAVRWISDRTLRRALREHDLVRRADALAVLDEAIAAYEALGIADVHERRLPA